MDQSSLVKIFYALFPVIAWGTWLAPSQNVRFPNQQIKTFYVTIANLVLVLLALSFQGWGGLLSINSVSFWMVFAGGVIWAISGLCAFTATYHIGTARAFGIWAPLNILVSMLWGALLFAEFPNTSSTSLLILGLALVITIAGVLMIIFAKGESNSRDSTRNAWLGYAGAVGAGVLWGSYFIPIKYAQIPEAVGALPLALGMFCGSLLLTILARQSPRIDRRSTFLALLTGAIWSIGNYGMLLLVGVIGAGRGFTIAQLSVVVNALVGIFWLKDPAPRSRAAWLTFFGCALAMLGGILLGNLK